MTRARAFVAVRPPDDVLAALGARVEPLSVGGARWTTPDQWHVTLRFLGNEADPDAVAGALAALALHAGVVRLGGAGAFPSARRGRILWVGMTEGEQFLAQLAAAVDSLVAPLGHEPEARPYHAHLTVARCKVPTDLREALGAFGDTPVGPAWPVREVVVYESRTRPGGATYVPRARIPLAPRG